MNRETDRQCELYNIERISYTDALTMQHELHAKCVAGSVDHSLVLLEHDPVITLGVKSTSRVNLVANEDMLGRAGVELAETDRGGDITYHGPGQLTGYPIFRLRNLKTSDVHIYLRSLEQCMIDTLAAYGLAGKCMDSAGVWVANKKVCSIGVAVRKFVTYHGFALNVDPNMEHFSLINPCGLDSDKMTSMKELLGFSPSMEDVRRIVACSFAEVFELDMHPSAI